jgi:hypothetical protein
LAEWKESMFIKEAFPPEYSWLIGDPILVRVDDGRFTKLNASVFPGHRGEGFTEDAMMLVNERYHYNVTADMNSLLSMELSEILAQSDNVEIILDNWRPVVVLDGELLTSYFMGDEWVPEQQFKEITVVKTALPDHIRYNEPSDITDLLKEGAGTFAAGTSIYEGGNHYFIRNQKEPHTWSILLPEGQAAHRLNQDRQGEVLYWESYQSRRYFVKENAQGHEVYSAQDPNTTENCILTWDEPNRRFHSPCNSIQYNIDGQPSEQGASTMTRWPSREWGGVLIYTYGE